MATMSFAMLLLATLFAAGQQAARPCATDAHNALDFWIGQWDVVSPTGAPAGVSQVERILDGCVVMESWSSVGSPYKGRSFNTYDGATGKWTQHWVDSSGASVLMTGAFEGKNLVYLRNFVRPDGTPVTARMTFFNLGDGGVRQLVEHSTDQGRTWTTQIDLTYRRSRA